MSKPSSVFPRLSTLLASTQLMKHMDQSKMWVHLSSPEERIKNSSFREPKVILLHQQFDSFICKIVKTSVPSYHMD